MRKYPSMLERDLEEYIDYMAWQEEKKNSDSGWQSRQLARFAPETKREPWEIEKGVQIIERLKALLKRP